METGDNKSEYRADNVDTDEREHIWSEPTIVATEEVQLR